MALHLVSVLIDTAEEVRPTMDIHDASFTLLTFLLACVKISPHFDPIGL